MDKYLQRRIARGMAIPEDDVQVEDAWFEGEDVLTVKGTVKSQSGQQEYATTISFTISSKKLARGFCSCPDCASKEIKFRSIVGFCKHQAAMAFRVKDELRVTEAAEREAYIAHLGQGLGFAPA